MSTEFSKIGSIDSNVLVVTPPSSLEFEPSATKHRDKTMDFLMRFDRERMWGIYTWHHDMPPPFMVYRAGGGHSSCWPLAAGQWRAGGGGDRVTILAPAHCQVQPRRQPSSSDSPLFGNVLENSSILHRAVGHNTAHHGAASFMIRLVVIIRKYSQVMTVS